MVRKTMQERKIQVLQAIEQYAARNGYSPNFREISKITGIKSISHVSKIIDALVEDGSHTHQRGVSRSITKKTSKPAVFRGVNKIPLAGVIQAGSPIHIPGNEFAHYDEEMGIELPADLTGPVRGQVFALTVQGDSMVGDLIDDGDLVILEANAEIRKGDMVAAYIKDTGAVTLKRYFFEGGMVVLKPSNPAYDPIREKPENVEIHGKVVTVIRRLNQ